MANRNLKLDLINEIKSRLKEVMGGCGTILIDDTATHAGSWYCVIPQEITEFDASECSTDITDFPSGDFYVGAGMPLFGNWTAIALDSGSVIAFTKC